MPSDSAQVRVLFICKLPRSQFWSFLRVCFRPPPAPGASWFLLLHFHFRLRFLSFDFPFNFVISLLLFVSLFPPLLRPPSYFDKLNSPTFPNSLFFLFVVQSELFPRIHFGISIRSHSVVMDTLKLPKSCPLHPLAPPQHSSGPSLITPNVPTLCTHSSPPSPSANCLPVSRWQLQ